jgi:hypothetical protein
MRGHTGHNILGNYCWNCHKPTIVGVPGWPKPSRDDGPRDEEREITSVVWADGTEDDARECVICKTLNVCKNPVYKEEYQEVGKHVSES